jgi:hypothetical protein
MKRAVVALLLAALAFATAARAQFIPGQVLTATQLNAALSHPNITGGTVVTSVLTGNLLLSNFNGGTGATVNTCWLGNLTWGVCAPAGAGLTLTGRTLSLSIPGSVNDPLISTGTGSATNGARSGNTTTFATTSGALVSGHCVKADASGNLLDSGDTCGSGVGIAIAVTFLRFGL